MNRHSSTEHQIPSATRHLRPAKWPSVLFVAVLLLSSTLLLGGCGTEETRRQVDLDILLPDSWAVDEVLRLDTDGDDSCGVKQWINPAVWRLSGAWHCAERYPAADISGLDVTP